MTKWRVILMVVVAMSVASALQAQPDVRSDADVLASPEWLEGRLDATDLVVLHAESRREVYERGHLPGARFLDMGRLVWDGEPAWGAELTSASAIEEALEAAGVGDRTRAIVVYGSNPLLAARAFMTLEVMGLRGRVRMLDGGYGGWVADGRPTSTDEPVFASGDLTLHPIDGVIVSADWVHERLDDPFIALVDARPDDEYTGEDGGMGGATHPGHIPGAGQLYWEDLVESRAVPRLRDRDRIARLFAEAGADTGDTVVTYCMVGLRASFTYFAARMLGYETKIYDGSWHDWGTRPDLPYVTGRSPR